MFKDNWEKTNTRIKISDAAIKKIVEQSIPHNTLNRFQVISGGCANINIKLFFLEKLEPLILRIYIRDKNAVYREQKISNLIKGIIPIPTYYCIGKTDEYTYAIIECMPGITLREYLLNNLSENKYDIMYDVGQMLGKIQSFRFKSPGFFDNNLDIVVPLNKDSYSSFLKECLLDQTVIHYLGLPTIKKILQLNQKNIAILNDLLTTHLVHGDYDPSNILINKIAGEWKLSAVLDWEFAFSGSWLCDVSNMLRYAYKLPLHYESNFIRGLEDFGLIMPEYWLIKIRLINLLSLLDSLKNCGSSERPNQTSDICNLIHDIIEALN